MIIIIIFEKMSDFEYLLKFIVVGDTGNYNIYKGVGKSCVVSQFI